MTLEHKEQTLVLSELTPILDPTEHIPSCYI